MSNEKKVESHPDLAETIMYCLTSPNEVDRNFETANIVDGLFAIARANEKIARAIERLGVNDAATPMGAIELLAGEIRNLKQ
jgi:hypothetical protein